MLALLAQQTARIGHPILGYIIPAIIFAVSFLVAFALYKHFTKKVE
ncbi:MAG: hypothetical protein ONB05_00455 [candidate division KSB1 bacterium]|nr:hypothetical protein [candidate division KSB1 bacterium]